MDSAAVDGDVEDAVDEDEGWEMVTCFCVKVTMIKYPCKVHFIWKIHLI